MKTEMVVKISEYIKTNRNRPFERGVFDCCVFVSDIMEIQTGLDLFAPYRGMYNDEKGALRALKKIGSIESQLDKHFKRIDPALAQRGDISMLESDAMAAHFAGGILALSSEGIAFTDQKPKICWSVSTWSEG